MKKFWSVLLAAFLVLSLGSTPVEAKRLGSGGSFGRQSQSVNRMPRPAAPSQDFNTPRQAAPAAAAPQPMPTKPASPWRGMLGGALLGLGLGALLSHFGLGGAMAGVLGSLLTIGLVIVAIMFVFRLFSRRTPAGDYPAYASGNSGGFAVPEIGSRLNPSASATPAANNAPWGVPPGFDTQGFLRQAKTNFIRMQAAWDRADINDIRDFTTPETFAELRLQLQERGASSNHTDVVSLDAELLGIETNAYDYLASVRFSGMIKEAENAPAEPVSEVWNLVKPIDGSSGWLLAGIQQLH
jgi:predicted lipid-binding transport protein (Tim44 family)